MPYETDQEQMEMLKRLWQDYGKWVVLTLIVGLALGFGWRYWQQQQLTHRQQASAMYQQLLVANSENNTEVVVQISGEIVKRYPKTEYAHLANLMAAKAAVSKDNFDLASQQLTQVMNDSKNKGLQQIARLRLARVLLTQGKTQEALKTVSVVTDKTYQPLNDEITGDIYMAMNDVAKAHAAYQAAQLGLSSAGGEDRLLAMKLAQPSRRDK